MQALVNVKCSAYEKKKVILCIFNVQTVFGVQCFYSPVATIIPGAEFLVEIVPDK